MNQPLFLYADYVPGTYVSGGTKAGLDPMDVLEADEDNVWQPDSLDDNKTLTFNMADDKLIGCIGIIGFNLSGLNVEVHASTDGFISSDVTIATGVLSSDASWFKFDPQVYRYWRLIMTGFTSSTAIAHVALADYNPLPFLEDGVDLDNFGAEGTLLISPDGRFLGASYQRIMKQIKLNWGQVTNTEYDLLKLWAENCMALMKPFFFVPDIDEDVCYFAWCDPKQKFSAPMKNGLYSIGSITINARIS